MQTIRLRLATNELCNFTNLPITSCILGPNVLTTLVLNTLNVCPSLNMRDQDCNTNKGKSVYILRSVITMFAYSRQKKVHFMLTELHKLYIHKIS